MDPSTVTTKDIVYFDSQLDILSYFLMHVIRKLYPGTKFEDLVTCMDEAVTECAKIRAEDEWAYDIDPNRKVDIFRLLV